MHRLTLAGLRKAKASTAGVYLWEPDAQAGAPTTLLGYKVLTCDAMPTNVAGNFPVLFGNFRRGYQLCDRVGMTIIMDPYTTPGLTRFYVSRRIGGRIRNNDAIKAVKNV
jgi:HK97 family phage major capsid protein